MKTRGTCSDSHRQLSKGLSPKSGPAGLRAALRLRNLACAAVLAGLPLAAGVSRGQMGGMQYPVKDTTSLQDKTAPIGGHNMDPNQQTEASSESPAENQRRMEQMNALRQKEMTEDAGKLLALATELKTDLDKTGKDTLSLDVIKKTEQIEKLAKSVRQKMKLSIAN